MPRIENDKIINQSVYDNNLSPTDSLNTKMNVHEILKNSGQMPSLTRTLVIGGGGLIATSLLSKDIRLQASNELVQLSQKLFFEVIISSTIPIFYQTNDITKLYVKAYDLEYTFERMGPTNITLFKSFLIPLIDEVIFRSVLQEKIITSVIKAIGITPPSTAEVLSMKAKENDYSIFLLRSLKILPSSFPATDAPDCYEQLENISASYIPGISRVVSSLLAGAYHANNPLQSSKAYNNALNLGQIYQENGFVAAVAAHSTTNMANELLKSSGKISNLAVLHTAVDAIIKDRPLLSAEINRFKKYEGTSIAAPIDALRAHIESLKTKNVIEKSSFEDKKMKLLNLAKSVVSHPKLFIPLLLLIVFNKEFDHKEKQKLLSQMLDLLPGGLTLYSSATNMLYLSIYKAIQSDISRFIQEEPNITLFALKDKIAVHILPNSGLEDEEIKEIAKMALFFKKPIEVHELKYLLTQVYFGDAPT